MPQKTSAECKTLDNYYKRMLVLINLVKEYKGNPKMIGTCVKLIKRERNGVEQGKNAVSDDDVREVVWMYDELLKNAKLIKSTSDAAVYSKSCAKLEELEHKAQKERAELSSLAGLRGETVVDKIKSGVKKLGGIVDGAVDKLKKTVTDENSE